MEVGGADLDSDRLVVDQVILGGEHLVVPRGRRKAKGCTVGAETVVEVDFSVMEEEDGMGNVVGA